MKKQCIIIGLGIYGMSVAKKLSDEGIEVLAIDKDMKIVEKASSFVTKAICMDITSIDTFEGIPVGDFDIGIVGIGEDISLSIMACLALKEAGVGYIIAKAGNKLHKQILKKLDVDEIVLPEEYLGIMTAKNILENKEIRKNLIKIKHIKSSNITFILLDFNGYIIFFKSLDSINNKVLYYMSRKIYLINNTILIYIFIRTLKIK